MAQLTQITRMAKGPQMAQMTQITRMAKGPQMAQLTQITRMARGPQMAQMPQITRMAKGPQMAQMTDALQTGQRAVEAPPALSVPSATSVDVFCGRCLQSARRKG